MTDTAEETPAAPQRRSPGRAWWSLAVTLVVVGAGLFVFDFFSAGSEVARRGGLDPSEYRPPIYGRFTPSFTRWGAIALGLAGVIAVGAFLASRRDRVRPAVLLPVALVALIAFAGAVAFVNGQKTAIVRPLQTRAEDYQVDVKSVRALGVRPFIERFPEIAHTMKSVHSRDHPPGPIVLLSVLQSLSPRHLVPRAVALAVLSSTMVVAAWIIARRVSGERAALFAALLVAVAPGVTIFTFTSLDAVFGAMLAGSAAILVWGIVPPGRLPFAFLGGVALALASFMTYGFLWVVAFAGLFAILTRGLRASIRPLVVIAAGFVVGLAILRVSLGYDLISTYRASYELVPQLGRRSGLYWLFGDPAAWLTFAGLPIAALSIRELVLERSRYLIALFTPLLLVDATTIFRGEVERVGIFAYPLVAVAAGAALARWEERSGKRRPGVVAALVAFAALQTVALEALFFTYW